MGPNQYLDEFMHSNYSNEENFKNLWIVQTKKKQENFAEKNRHSNKYMVLNILCFWNSYIYEEESKNFASKSIF